MKSAKKLIVEKCFFFLCSFAFDFDFCGHTHTHTQKPLKPPYLWMLKFLCKTTDRKKLNIHTTKHICTNTHIFWASFVGSFMQQERVQRYIVILHCFFSSHIPFFSRLYVWVSIWSNHLCICKASITLIFKPQLQRVSSPVKQNAVSFSLSLWPVLTASLTFPYPSILILPCSFSPSFSHTFTFSSRDQSAGQDVVPLEPWSIAVAHEERKKWTGGKGESGWTSLYVLLSMHWHGLCGSPLRI